MDPRLAYRSRHMGTEAAFRVFARARQLEAAGRDIVHLEMGEPDVPTPAYIRRACASALEAGHTGYTPAAGLPALREAIATHMFATRGLTYAPEQIVVMPGGKAVIFAAFMSLVEKGDEVVLPDPGFPIFASLADSLGAVARTYDPGSGREVRPDVDALVAAIGPKTKLIVLNSPGNPTGVVHRLDELQRIAAACAGSKAIVLADEIYSRILYDGVAHVSFATLPGMMERTILLDGFSKTWSMTGWRLGWAAAPPALASAFERLMTNTSSCVVNFAQHGALAALAGPTDDVERMVAIFSERRDVLVEGLSRLGGVRVAVPEGSFFCWADVRERGASARVLADRLLEEAGVACVEGPAFGRRGEGFLRFSFATDAARIQEAMRRVRTLLDG